ncbi:DUF721 domain-containing protein [Puteibacter caeruleilacunae]|nr:DUF721 domain-containing protein [Puteibacter caeruleilacunae]
MRRNETQKLSDVLKEYVKKNKMDSHLKEADVVASWEKVLGKTVASSTTKIYIRNRILFVFLKSSIIRNELFMMRDQIKDALNREAGGNVIDHVIVK